MKTLARREILKMAVEDYYGLWEVIWALSEKYPGHSEAELLDLAHEVTRDLLALGFISVYSRQGADGIEVELEGVDAEAAFSSSQSWIEPSASTTQILIGATAKGEKESYS